MDFTLSDSQRSLSGSLSSLNSHQGVPIQPQSQHSAPLSLQDIQDPGTFRLDSPSSKKRVTKANFINKTPGLSEQLDPSDPFNTLDPTWAVKK